MRNCLKKILKFFIDALFYAIKFSSGNLDETCVLASASMYIDEGGFCFRVRFFFFFTNNIFWDVLGYEDGVLKSWLMACLKGLLIFHAILIFDLVGALGGPEVGRKLHFFLYVVQQASKKSKI